MSDHEPTDLETATQNFAEYIAPAFVPAPAPPAPTREERIEAMARAMCEADAKEPGAWPLYDQWMRWSDTYVLRSTAAYDALLAMGAIRTGKE